jgi:hypothetical protein
LPNSAWVPEYNDLDKKYFAEIIKKCIQPLIFKSTDGENIKRFTVPCADQIVRE